MADLEHLDVGMVYDLMIERANDEQGETEQTDVREATQADYNRF